MNLLQMPCVITQDKKTTSNLRKNEVIKLDFNFSLSISSWFVGWRHGTVCAWGMAKLGYNNSCYSVYQIYLQFPFSKVWSVVMHIQIIIWYGNFFSENFKTAATLAFKARGCYCDYYITVECSFLCLLKKRCLMFSQQASYTMGNFARSKEF